MSGVCYNNGAIRIIDELGYRSASLSVPGDLELRGNGTVELISSEEPDNAIILLEDNATLEVGAGQLIIGNGAIQGPGMITNNGVIQGALIVGGLGSTFINDGLVIANDSQSPLRLEETHLAGSGKYIADGSELNLAGSGISGLVLERKNGGRIIVQNGFVGMRDQINTELIEVLSGYTGASIRPSGSIINNGCIRLGTSGDQSTTTIIHATGEDATFSGDGVVELNAPDDPYRAGIYVNRDRSLTFGPQQSLIGRGSLYGEGEIQIDGELNPSGDSPLITIESQLLLSSGSRIVLDGIGGDHPDRLVVQGKGMLLADGILDLRFDDTVTPAFGDRWTLIEGATQHGYFDAIDAPEPPVGLVYRVITNSNETFVVLTCPGDLNGDFRVDYIDVALFVARYGTEDGRADLNSDGDINFYDVARFIEMVTQGCR